MKKVICCVVGVLILGFALTCPASERQPESSKTPAVVVIADTTGSMQQPIELTNENGTKEKISKIASLKEMLMKITAENSFSDRQFGIYGARYIGGGHTCYEVLLPLNTYGADELSEEIHKGMVTDYAVFNRRSATANALRQLEKDVFRHLSGPVTVLIASDGLENMHDLDDDRDERRTDFSVIGPLSEVQLLKKKYGDRLKVLTLFWDQTMDDQHDGKLLLAEMGGDKSFELWDFRADTTPADALYQALIQVKGAE